VVCGALCVCRAYKVRASSEEQLLDAQTDGGALSSCK
jgi:hypothetical protein